MKIIVTLLLLSSSMPCAHAATRTWTGEGFINTWSTLHNWDSSGPIGLNGDNLVFPSGLASTNTMYDLPMTLFHDVTFHDSWLVTRFSFERDDLSGMELSGTMRTTPLAGVTLFTPHLFLTHSASFMAGSLSTLRLEGDVAFNGHSLTVNAEGGVICDGAFRDNGIIYKYGDGKFTLSGSTTASVNVEMNKGTLQVDGTSPELDVNLRPGCVLRGHGRLGYVENRGGIVRPGENGQGKLAVANVILNYDGSTQGQARGVLEIAMGMDFLSPTSATLQVESGYINGAELRLNLLPGFMASPGASFLIMEKTNPLSLGTFHGLPEGAVFAAGGKHFAITYQAGPDSNDVMVTVVHGPATLTIKSISDGVELAIKGESNVPYMLQQSSDLETWTDMLDEPLVLPPPVTTKTYQFPTNQPWLFYRVMNAEATVHP